MDNSANSAAELLMDPFFQEWVLHPGKENNLIWENRLAGNPSLAEEVEKARKALLLIQFEQHQIPQGAKDRVWKKIRQIRQPEEAVLVQLYPNQPAWWMQTLRVAAMYGGLLILAGLLSYVYFTRTLTYTTGFGEVRTVMLPDASEVTLNGNSSIRLANTWFAFQDRQVELKGEAYFTVRHTKNHQRFLVQVGNRAQVEVLGTEFNVYNRERETRVFLNSGRVQLNLLTGKGQDQESNSVAMVTGELLTLDSSLPEGYTRKVVDPAIYAALKDQKLVFSRSTLAEVFQVLEDVYGLQVRISDPGLSELLFTGSSPIQQPKLLFTALSKSFNLRFSRQENVIFIQAE
jgi:transmembrane sensor